MVVGHTGAKLGVDVPATLSMGKLCFGMVVGSAAGVGRVIVGSAADVPAALSMGKLCFGMVVGSAAGVKLGADVPSAISTWAVGGVIASGINIFRNILFVLM